jgi:hypothetical protein
LCGRLGVFRLLSHCSRAVVPTRTRSHACAGGPRARSAPTPPQRCAARRRADSNPRPGRRARVLWRSTHSQARSPGLGSREGRVTLRCEPTPSSRGCVGCWTRRRRGRLGRHSESRRGRSRRRARGSAAAPASKGDLDLHKPPESEPATDPAANPLGRAASGGGPVGRRGAPQQDSDRLGGRRGPAALRSPGAGPVPRARPCAATGSPAEPQRGTAVIERARADLLSLKLSAPTQMWAGSDSRAKLAALFVQIFTGIQTAQLTQSMSLLAAHICRDTIE